MVYTGCPDIPYTWTFRSVFDGAFAESAEGARRATLLGAIDRSPATCSAGRSPRSPAAFPPRLAKIPALRSLCLRILSLLCLFLCVLCAGGPLWPLFFLYSVFYDVTVLYSAPCPSSPAPSSNSSTRPPPNGCAALPTPPPPPSTSP